MREYQVTEPCYVPVGTGRRFKHAGQRVRLSADDAAELGDLVAPIPDSVQPVNTLLREGSDKGVQKLNTAHKGKKPTEPTETGEEVDGDGSEPGAADERAAGQD